MAGELNVTYFILDGHVELHKFRYIYFAVFFIIYIIIICSNSIIVYLIWKHQDLHEPMYIFIAALLLNSVVFSTNIYPKLLVDILSDEQIISFQACIVQFYMFYVLATSEFLLLAAMAYDRYVSICKPLQYPTIMKKTTVSVYLAVSWLLPACLLVGLASMAAKEKYCSLILKVIFCNNTIYKLFCVTPKALSVFTVLTLLAGFPLMFIIFSYTRILIICYRSCGEVKKKAAQSCLSHLLILINYFFGGILDVVIVRLDSDLSNTAHLIITLQFVLFNPIFNPIIYGLKMKEITKHLQRLFCGHKKLILK